jgi:hypothetical protein
MALRPVPFIRLMWFVLWGCFYGRRGETLPRSASSTSDAKTKASTWWADVQDGWNQHIAKVLR